MAITLKHATLTELGTAFREAYRDAQGERACRLARWVLARIADGTFTDTQIRNFFGLNTTQYNQMKTRMTTAANTLTSLEEAVGE